MSKILIVAAHPDDEIIGCAGTMIKKISEGHEVYSLILGEGITARYSNRINADKNTIEKLNAETNEIAKFIGFKKNWSFSLPDNRFDTVPLLDIVKLVESVKKEIGPDSVYTHFCDDLNIDHRITFNAVLTACRPIVGETVKNIYSFETCSSTEWVNTTHTSFRPNNFVDISDHITKKLEALAMYKSEMCEYPHPRSLKSIELLAKYRGTIVSKHYAEAFDLVRSIE